MKRTITFVASAFIAITLHSQNRNDFSGIKGTHIQSSSSLTNLPSMVIIDSDQNVSTSLFPAWMKTSFINDNQVSLSLVKTEKDQMGNMHNRFQELYKGYKIENAMITSHGVGNKVQSFSGEWYRDITPANRVSINKEQALALALNKVNAKKYKWENKEEEAHMKQALKNPDFTYKPVAELVILAAPDKKAQTVTYSYAYKFNIYAEEPLSRANIYVDATSGEILKVQNLICTTDVIGSASTKYSGTQQITSDSYSGSYRLRESGRGGGIQTYNLNHSTSYTNTDFTNATSNWTITGANQAATDAHWGAEKTYDYYSSTFSRNSIDNAGFPLLSYVHYNNSYANAFWDGQRMTYGDGNGTSFGIMTALDVCGHEITHGLVSNTAQLGGSGTDECDALNEAFADIFGTTIEAYARPTQHDWLMGLDISLTGTPIRNMSNPAALGQPDTYLGTNWDSNGEPHNNNGPCIFWYYLLCTGGSGTNDNSQAYTVNGIGMTSAAAIAYRALTVYMTPSTTYANVRNFTIQAATDLFGACSNEVRQTTNAWYAVGVGAQTTCPAYALDASVSSVINPGSNLTYCVGSVTPTIVLRNSGTTVLTSALIQYKMDATATQNLNWTGSLATSASVTLSLNPYSALASGAHTFTAGVSLPNGGTDQSTSNDSKSVAFNVAVYMSLPFTETFESTTFPPANWTYNNASTTNTSLAWARVANATGIPVTPVSTACAKMNTFDGAASDIGQINGLLSPGLNFTTANSATKLYFDVSHQVYSSTYKDSLTVLITSNCGQTWSTIYAKGDPLTLPTVSGGNTSSFAPTANSQWRRDSLSLAAYAGNSTIFILFRVKNGSGNNIYLDNINIKTPATSSTPVASISSVSSLCQGTSVTLNGSGTNSPTSWSWTIPGGTPSTSSAQNPSVTYATAGTYTATLVAGNSAGNSTAVTKVITVTAPPTVSATSATICAGGSATLTASGASTYTWNTGQSGSILVVSPTVNTSYTMGGSSAPGCTNYVTANVIIASAPAIAVNSATTCAGSNVVLTANGVNTFTWSTSSNASSITVNPTSTTIYTVTGNMAGCSVPATKTATVTVNPLPVVALAPIAPLCLNSVPVTLSGSPSNGTLTGTGVMTNSVFDPSVSGAGTFPVNYYYTSSNGCSNFATQIATVSICTGLQELANGAVSVYPNPVTEFVTITLNSVQIEQHTTIELYDNMGKLVLAEKTADASITLNMKQLATGIYALKINAGNYQKNIRLVKE